MGTHVLDVETLYLSSDLPGGWDDIAKMRVAVCVLYDLGADSLRVFSADTELGEPLESLFSLLEQCRENGCAVIGHNILRFDWTVIAGEWRSRGLIPDVDEYLPGKARIVDTMAILYEKLGWRPSLQLLSQLNLSESKLLDAALAPVLWKSGDPESRRLVVRYCADDVLKTLKLWEKGRKQGTLKIGGGPQNAAVVDVAVAW
ncbi:MAG: hypothetical protein HY556_03650 [Euryarchaeota archaeon]|nr:hypothetical protein [Euryarchaeota archaeon]